ncbi:membrane protein [Streptomyces platensis subsp. clarensis]|nr:membrane protein [Streptomyces platensis subsp. clarensis]
MTVETMAEDAEAAGRLIGYGFRPKIRPARDSAYAALVKRYAEDPDFETLVTRYAAGMGLRVIAVTSRAGMVHTALPGSAFETRMDQYARHVRMRESREAERILYGITHLAVAALAFPRPEDLADDGYQGKVRVSSIDQLVRSVCRVLAERVAESEESQDPLAETPELERAWRAYERRPEVALTKGGRSGVSATRSLIGRALAHLVDRGMFLHGRADAEGGEKSFVATHRYQVHVRELASTRAYEELTALGVLPPIAGTGTLRTTRADTLYD